MRNWALGLSVLVLTACSGGGGGGDEGSSQSTASPDPQPVEQFQPYDTSVLATINAPASDTNAAPPALDDPDTIAVVDQAFVLDHSAYDDRVLSYYDALRAVGDPRYTDQEPAPGYRTHGTAVASLAAGSNVGVSPNSGLILVRVAEAVDANTELAFPNDALALGLELLVGQGADIVNLSMSVSDYQGPEAGDTQRIRTALTDGINQDDWVVVVAAGNQSRGVSGAAGNTDFPDYEGQLLAVGALATTTPEPTMAAFSNNAEWNSRGDLVGHFIVAPGLAVCAAYDQPNTGGGYLRSCNQPTQAQIDAGMATDDPSQAYSSFSGTSAATPIVSGAAARMRRAHPELDGSDVVRLLLETATDFGEPGYDKVFGAGLINLEAALAAAETYVAPKAKLQRFAAVRTDARVQSAPVERSRPSNAIQIGEDAFMVPTAPAPSGCMMFTPWSADGATTTAIYWRNLRGEFSLSPAGCLVEKGAGLS